MTAPWLGAGDGIALASRVRLARNLEDLPFRGTLPPAAARELCERVEGLMAPVGLVACADDRSTQAVLLSDGLRVPSDLAEATSPWMALERGHSGLLVLQSDHFRLWSVRSGLDLLGALDDVSVLEPELWRAGPLARDREWGWRTASPEDVGTGLRAGVLLNTPALWLSRRLGPLAEGLAALGGRLSSPWHGEEPGPLVVVANRRTLGVSELVVADEVTRWAARVRQEEEKAARDLVEHWGADLRDSVHRSDAILGSCRLLSEAELRQRVALVALGVRTGWLAGRDIALVLELLVSLREGTLRIRRAQGIPEAHPKLDDLRADEAREIWNRPRP